MGLDMNQLWAVMVSLWATNGEKIKVPVQYAPVVELVKPVTGISAHNSAKTEWIFKRKAIEKQLKRACKNIRKASFLSL